DQGEALTMSDRIAVMNQGLVEQFGPPMEIYEMPATRFVADFIGVSNLLSGEVERVADGTAVLRTGCQESLIVPSQQGAARDRASLAAGSMAEFTVRPEKITISADRPDADNVLRG